jgi:uncharacterized membrane protein YozB (DUF420 family)
MAYLGISIANAAAISLIIQTIAYAILIAGFVFAKKKDFKIHKKTMTVATLLNFASLFIVMLPSFYSIVSGISLAAISSSSSIIIFHHSIGLITLVLASLVILRGCSSIVKNTRILMITIFTLWSISYFLGIYIYSMFYLPLVFIK